MNENKQVNLLDKKIEKAAKKLNIFNIDDIANIIEASKKDIMVSLNNLIDKGIIKNHSDGFIVIPPKPTTVYYSPNYIPEEDNDNNNKKDSSKDKELDILIKNLTPELTNPQEIYIKHFGEIEGYYKYFFAPLEVREKILFILQSLKSTQDMSDEIINDYCYENGLIFDSYKKAAELLPRKGFSLFLPEYTLEDPIEIYEFFKAFYLAPYGLSAKEALELAHERFEKYIIDAEVNWEYFKGPWYYLRKVVNDYSIPSIRKMRRYNYSEFDFDSMKLENVNKPH